MVIGDHEAGNDYAVIPLYPFIKRALKDAGKVPFTSADVAEAGEHFDCFWLIGVPEEGTISEEVTRVDREKITFNISLHQLTPLSDPPRWRRQKIGDRFFCKVELGSMTSVRGLSGGPIIGVKDLDANNYAYKVVGIQSGWCPSYKEIEAYSAHILTSALDHHVGKLAQEPVPEAATTT